jgi:hypothetical protein
MRCMIMRRHSASVKRYTNGSYDITAGPPDPNLFPLKEEDPRYKRFAALDRGMYVEKLSYVSHQFHCSCRYLWYYI